MQQKQPKNKKPVYNQINKGNNLQNHIDFLKNTKSNFTLENSTYTAKIITEKTIINFTTKNLTMKCFIAAQMIKGDINKSNISKPKISVHDLEYFEQNLKSELINKVVNFDITKAYPTILFADGFITKKTFEYLCNVNKTERLAAIGMLARKKNITTFENGKPINTTIDRKNTSEYFFYLVDKTNKIISEIRQKCKLRFLFSWVDGIYFEYSNENDLFAATKTVNEICETYKLKFTTEILTEYVSHFHNGFFQVYFNKGETVKRFSIPSNEIKANYLTYKKLNSIA
jgi:hypothetical protein